MKITDLMIGDWVLDNGTPTKMTLTLMTFINLDIRNYQPIPLTSKILEKNGFERSEVFVEWKYKNDDVYMIYKPFPYLKI